MTQSSLLIVGGTHGIGTEDRPPTTPSGVGRSCVAGRDESRAKSVAADVGGDTRGIALDLSEPEQIADASTDVGAVDHVVLSAIARDLNTMCRVRHRQGTLPRDHEAGRLHRRASVR